MTLDFNSDQPTLSEGPTFHEPGTMWDTTAPIQSFSPYSPIENYGGSNNLQLPGIDFKAPETDSSLTGDRPYGLLPIYPTTNGQANNIQTQFNFWNPASAIDSFFGVAKQIVPGLANVGDMLGQMGTNIANSDFGHAISNSPLAGIGSVAGDIVGSTMRGTGMIIGDALSPLGDAISAFNEGDWGKFATSLARAPLGPVMAGEKIGERAVNGFLKNDAQARAQVMDELGALSLLLGPVALARTGAAAALGRTAAGQLAKDAVISPMASAFGSGAAKTAIAAAKYTMGLGYGVEGGLELASHLSPDADAFAKQVAANRLIPEASPFRGAYDLGLAGLVDPFPMLGRIVDSKAGRAMLNNLPPMPNAAQTHWGMDVPRDAALWDADHVHTQVAVNDIIAEGNHRLGNADFNAAVGERKQTLYDMRDGKLGNDGVMAYYHRMQQEHMEQSADTANGAFFNEKQFGRDEWVANQSDYRLKEQILRDAEGANGVTDAWNNPTTALTRGSTITTGDVNRYIDEVLRERYDPPGTRVGKGLTEDGLASKIGRGRNPLIGETTRSALSRYGLDGLTDRRSPGGILQDLRKARTELPNEPYGDHPLADAAGKIRSDGRYKVIELGGQKPRSENSPLGDKTSIVRRDFERVWRESGPKDATGKPVPHGLTSSSTLKDAMDLMAANKMNPDRIKAWTKDGTVYTKDGISRPFYSTPPGYADRQQQGTRWGNYIASVRGFVPNTVMGAAWRERFYNTYLEKIPGASRDEIDRYRNLIFTSAKDSDKQGVFQLSSATLNRKAAEVWGDRASKFNFGQLLAETVPQDKGKLAGLLSVLMGKEVGKAGFGPSFFAARRASGSGQIGDAYRFWTQVAHPTLRYGWSPIFRAQAGAVEDAFYATMRGFGFYKPVEAEFMKALSDYAPDFIKDVAGRTAGMYVEHPSGATFNEKQLSQQRDYAVRQMAAELPKKFAEVFQKAHPQDWSMLTKTYGTADPQGLMKAIFGNKEAIKLFNKGEMAPETLLARAGLQPDTSSYTWLKGAGAEHAELMPTLNVLKYMEPGRAVAPGGEAPRFTLEKSAPVRDAFGDRPSYTIKDRDKPVGELQLNPSPDGKIINVDWIGHVSEGEVGHFDSASRELSKQLGPSGLRELADQIHKEFPNAEKVTGYRVGGSFSGFLDKDKPTAPGSGSRRDTRNPERSWDVNQVSPMAKYEAEKAALERDGFQSPLVMYYHSGTGEAVIADAPGRLQAAHELSNTKPEFNYVPVRIINDNTYIERLRNAGEVVAKIPAQQLKPGTLGASTFKLGSLPTNMKPSDLFRDFRPKEADDVIKAFTPIALALRDATQQAATQAASTMIFNPARSYMEKSLSHPLMVYPLSWTLRAGGEWARFLTHSAFGLPTGLSGLVAWNDIKNATGRSLANDPESSKWMKMHPETVKLMQFLMPGTPLGLGFGLASVPLRDAMQVGINAVNNRPLDENMKDMLRIGLLRDKDIYDKITSEWIRQKPKGSLVSKSGDLILNP